jgi:hypothetical protein
MKKQMLKIIDSRIRQTEGELLALRKIREELGDGDHYTKEELEMILAYLTLNHR